jgi:hypothetical protein
MTVTCPHNLSAVDQSEGKGGGDFYGIVGHAAGYPMRDEPRINWR